MSERSLDHLGKLQLDTVLDDLPLRTSAQKAELRPVRIISEERRT